uniref:Enhancer of mRNA-decapping protein 4 WD40 repeat region domain-containing protein n=1 Tax=Romanomermis culicivorax TaxID=13658 RepID=A0A915HJR3_ROMCU
MTRSFREPDVNYRLTFCPFVSDDSTYANSATSCPSDVDSFTRKSFTNNNLENKWSALFFSSNSEASTNLSNESLHSAYSAPSSSPLRSFGLLSVSYGRKVDVIDLESLVENHGRVVDIENCQHGLARFESNGEVLAMALSPDATALAVANSVGEVVFYLMESFSEFRKAHLWTPHGNRPVSAIYFLDDVTLMNKEIGAYEDFDISSHKPLVLAMDWTANYLFLSDIDRKSLYIIQIGVTDSAVRFLSFSEFPLVQPALSLAVVEASKKKFRPFSPGSYHDLGKERRKLSFFYSQNLFVSFWNEDRVAGDIDENDGKVAGVRAILYAVNPKSLLQLEIRYQPSVLEGGDSHFDSTPSFKLDPFRDHLSDLSSESNVVVASETDELAKFFHRRSKDMEEV